MIRVICYLKKGLRVAHKAEPVFRCKYNPLVDACGSGEENLVAAILAHDSSSLNKADQVRESSHPTIASGQRT